ncbi:hypothetical protein BCR22_02580 [Enterococcus plantarum]|uniref:hypothetical protein n=1 Tax=Enterococcus plantarum TaxID=1077675 RepID=UPI00084CEFAF|nr:hypothetical protein [Enterococcus plantarum]OEG17561.1 hypothetical protein BCR22_02580 [Enterococcus plantarum]
MVQINKVAPFQLKNFDTMIKTYGTFFLVGLFLQIFPVLAIQKKRLIFFAIFFLTLMLMALIGKIFFKKKKNEVIGLWLLFITMILANFGILLVPFIGYAEQTIGELLYYYMLTILVTLLFMVYVHLVYRYGRKRLSDKVIGIMVGVPFVLVMIFSIFMIEKYGNFSVGLIGIGMLFLSGTLKQYPRIGAYFEQKNMNRYGNSLDIVNKKKEGEKNE